MKLSATHTRVLQAIADGWSLKSHRYLNGAKVYQLHPLDGAPQTVDQATVEFLCEHHLIDSNKKFPSATYWLTEAGRQLIERKKPGFLEKPGF